MARAPYCRVPRIPLPGLMSGSLTAAGRAPADRSMLLASRSMCRANRLMCRASRSMYREGQLMFLASRLMPPAPRSIDQDTGQNIGQSNERNLDQSTGLSIGRRNTGHQDTEPSTGQSIGPRENITDTAPGSPWTRPGLIRSLRGLERTRGTHHPLGHPHRRRIRRIRRK